VAAQFVQNFLPGFEVDPDPTGLAAYGGKPQQVKHVNLTVTKKQIAEREKLQSEKTDDTHKFQVIDEEDGEEETTAEFISRQRAKIASERRKAVYDDVRRQSTAALSAKATKPKRASKKGDTVAS
jgi:hypothetical protein